MSNLIKKFKARHDQNHPEVMSMEEYLKAIKKDPSLYASPAERLLKAIGEPELIDTSKVPRLARLYQGRIIKRYKAFSDFYGMETIISQIVGFLTHAAQGLEESKQILYLLGPVGSAKSSLAIRLRELMQTQPICVIKGAPMQESPLDLFSASDSKDLGVPERYLRFPASPWLLEKLEQYGGDISQFEVEKIYPCESSQTAIAVEAAGDPMTQDISDLVGKVDMSKLESYSQDHPFAYSYSGGLCKGNQGILEFVEMFKADIKLLNPLLTATQEGNFPGTEGTSWMPFNGIVLAHSNESEWRGFISDQKNEAILDRITLIKVPYVLSLDEEVEIYKKKIRDSQLAEAPIAPNTLETLASFSVATRLDDVDEKITAPIKLEMYNGRDVMEKYSVQETYSTVRSMASTHEGFYGMSTRDAYKVLSKVYNHGIDEVAADPITVLEVLRNFVRSKEMSEEEVQECMAFIDGYLTDELYEKIGKDIQLAFLGSGMDDLGQNKFERYVVLASHWLDDTDYRDDNTGQLLDRELLNQELELIEKPASVNNHKDFRAKVVHFALQYQAKHGGDMPPWDSYWAFKEVLEKSLFNQMEDLLPVLSVSGKGRQEHKDKHKFFVEEMKRKGYTDKQIQRIQDWFVRKKYKKG